MASEWATKPLGELVENLDSRRIPLSSRERKRRYGPYPYYGATGVIDYVDDYLFEGLHLLVAEDGSVERPDGMPFVQLVNGRFWVNNHAHVLRGANDEETRYLYYALQTIRVRPYMSGSVQAKLSQSNLNRITVPYPQHASDRRAIAHVLGTLDDKIELNRRMARTLEEMARALFKAWFVDFEPVRAKMDGRWRRGESLPGLPAHLYDLFPDRLVDSELGPIPEGWGVAPLSQVCTQVRTQIHPQTEPDTVFLHYSIPAYDAGRQPVSELGKAIKSSKFGVEPGSVLLSKLNPEIERVWVPDVSPGSPAICSTEFMVLKPIKPCGRAWLYLLLVQSAFRETMQSLVTGTSKSHQRAQPKSVMSIGVVVPTQHIAQSFENHAGGLLNRILLLQRESEIACSIRDGLLPKLISGELPVKQAERLVGAQQYEA